MRPGLDPPAKPGGIGAGPLGVGHLERPEAVLADVPRLERIICLAFLATKRLWRHMKKPPPGSVVGGPGNRPIHISQACRWSLMELAPFPCGRLPGFHRASPSTPLDAYSYVS